MVSEVGDATTSILQSINLPPLSLPIFESDRALVDGGLLSNIPANVLVAKGCNFVIASSVTAKLERDFIGIRSKGRSLSHRFFSTIQVIMRQTMIQGFNMNSVGVQPAGFVVAPDMTSFDISEFTRADEMAVIGERTTNASIAKLRKMLSKLDSTLREFMNETRVKQCWACYTCLFIVKERPFGELPGSFLPVTLLVITADNQVVSEYHPYTAGFEPSFLREGLTWSEHRKLVRSYRLDQPLDLLLGMMCVCPLQAYSTDVAHACEALGLLSGKPRFDQVMTAQARCKEEHETKKLLCACGHGPELGCSSKCSTELCASVGFVRRELRLQRQRTTTVLGRHSCGRSDVATHW